MEIALKRYNRIFIEESCFFDTDFYAFLEALIAKRTDEKLDVYVPLAILDLIERYKNTFKERDAYTALGYLDILDQMNWLHKIDTKGYYDLSHVKTVLSAGPSTYILVMTQNESIFKSFDKMKEDLKELNIAKLANNQLVEWTSHPKTTNQAFYVENDIYINKVNIDTIDYVYSPKYGYLKLDKTNPFKGGEGILYRTYNNQLCKLYYDEHQTYVNYKKLGNMLEMDVHNPYVNWPKDIIYYKNDFVGYLMDEIKDTEGLDILRINGFKGYNVFNSFVLSYHLLKTIDYLHKKNIIIGDLKLDNILVKSPSEVYLVDCGCYQLDDFSCIVCHPEYTKKMYTSEELKKELRSVDDEYYPINKILFELLIRKNPHYNRESGEVDVENKSLFTFPLDLTKIKEPTPEMKLWSLLTDKMRNYFYYYFTENKVTYLSEWIDELEQFINHAKAKQQKGVS